MTVYVLVACVTVSCVMASFVVACCVMASGMLAICVMVLCMQVSCVTVSCVMNAYLEEQALLIHSRRRKFAASNFLPVLAIHFLSALILIKSPLDQRLCTVRRVPIRDGAMRLRHYTLAP